jgi:hypothetical protein
MDLQGPDIIVEDGEVLLIGERFDRVQVCSSKGRIKSTQPASQ